MVLYQGSIAYTNLRKPAKVAHAFICYPIKITAFGFDVQQDSIVKSAFPLPLD